MLIIISNYFMKSLLFVFVTAALFFSCQNNGVADLPTFTEEGVNAVVEIPAGSMETYRYDFESRSFEKDRDIDFLAYPANYGFIPNTAMAKEEQGDGGPLDVMVWGAAVPRGTILEVKPIAVLRLKDDGILDTKIIALPINSGGQNIKADNFVDFLLRYDAAKKIIEDWFLNYEGIDNTEFLGWEDEEYAQMLIKRSSLQ